MNKKVKIIAVAKDESAYFPEWIHHHLYVGVDAIDIYINRTTDNSLSLLTKITQHYPQVTIKSCDWIDTCPPEVNRFIQYVTYAQAFEQNNINQEYDYLFFLDIDEFWVPHNLDYKIQDMVKEMQYPSCVSMQWINQYADAEPFSYLSDVIKGDLVRNVKSLVHKNADLKRMSLHHPLFHKLGNAVMPDGETFCGSDGKVYRETLHATLSRVRKVMIIHRADRSELEYISLLFRGRPSDNIPLKLNREGMHIEHQNSSELCIEQVSFDAYELSRKAFFKLINIDNELKEARDFVTQRATEALKSISSLLATHPEELKRAFANVKHPEVVKQLCNYTSPKRKESDKLLSKSDEQEYKDASHRLKQSSFLVIFKALKANNADMYRDLALKLEPLSLKVAYKLMVKAKSLRPEGPLINRKLKQYTEKL
jgi:hypothetical protein